MEKAEEKPKGIWKLPDDFSGILSLLTTVLGAITGLVSVFYLVGYIVVNQRLLDIGVREFTLGNPAYLSAGIATTIIHVIAMLLPILIGRARKLFVVFGISACLVFLILEALTSVRNDSREYYLYLIGIPGLALCIDVVSSKERRAQFASKAGSRLFLIFLVLPILFFSLLAVWSRDIYPQMSASFGGGKPVRVQLVVADANNIKLFTQMGIHVDQNTTEPLELVDDNGTTLLLLLSNGTSARIDRTLVASIVYLHLRSALTPSASTPTPGSTPTTTPVPTSSLTP